MYGQVVIPRLRASVIHPEALRPYIVNWTDVAGHLVARLHREVAARPGDDALSRLLARVLAQPGVYFPADSASEAALRALDDSPRLI